MRSVLKTIVILGGLLTSLFGLDRARPNRLVRRPPRITIVFSTERMIIPPMFRGRRKRHSRCGSHANSTIRGRSEIRAAYSGTARASGIELNSIGTRLIPRAGRYPGAVRSCLEPSGRSGDACQKQSCQGRKDVRQCVPSVPEPTATKSEDVRPGSSQSYALRTWIKAVSEKAKVVPVL